MNDNRHSIPFALQTQIILQAALVVAALVAGIILSLWFSISVSLPLFVLALLFGLGGMRIYRVSTTNRYLTLLGTVLKVEQTAILRRPKALLLEIDGKAIRVVLRNRHRVPEEGGSVCLYVLDTTPIYEWHGLRQLSSYLALNLDCWGD